MRAKPAEQAEEEGSMNQRDQRYPEKKAEGNPATIAPQIRHQWPSLGRELFALEQGYSALSVSSQHLQAAQEKLRKDTLAQLYRAEGQYSRATRYLAFLLVKYGRGGVIVGNPSHLGEDGAPQTLPYTGLEGYYAGSEQTAGRPGLSQGDILWEEAERGAQILKRLKKDAVERNCWAEFVRVQHTLDGTEQTREAIQTIQTLWMTIVSQLRSRVYHNEEFEQTITECIEHAEHILGQTMRQTEEEKLLYQALQEEYRRLQETYSSMSAAEKEQERRERKKRERMRVERVETFQRFRDETYQILGASSQERYAVGIQDSSWDKATLMETIVLPRILSRETYPAVQVHFAPEELDGYLFLAKLGEIGADPLARSELVSEGIF